MQPRADFPAPEQMDYFVTYDRINNAATLERDDPCRKFCSSKPAIITMSPVLFGEAGVIFLRRATELSKFQRLDGKVFKVSQLVTYNDQEFTIRRFYAEKIENGISISVEIYNSSNGIYIVKLNDL